MSLRRKAFLLSALALGTAALSGVAHAQAWPTKPVRLLVGFPGGSTPDIAARVIAEPLSKALGQPVVVDNRAGASGNIATDMVAKATDDHTLGIVINGNLTSSKVLFPTLPYDPAKDFSYLSLIAKAPLVVVGSNNVPVGKDFLAAAKASGTQWNYGSVGVGSVAHLGMELLKSRLPGFQAQHVPYKGNPQVMTALLANEVQLALVPPGLALPQVQAGKVKAVGLTGSRSTLAPEVAPMSENGVSDFNLEVWTALLGPANLSSAAKTRIGEELSRIMRTPEVRQALFDRGWQPVGSSPEGMRLRVSEEAAIMKRIIQTSGIQVQ